jgi:UDP-N-acetylmuramate dehydrogenase
MTWMEEFDQKIADYLPHLAVQAMEPMNRHTSFRIGGPATRFAFPSTREELVILTGLCQQCGVNPLLIGNGTNLLISDEGVDTVVINTSAFLNQVHRTGEREIEADAGVALSKLALFAEEWELTGLEFAHGIPGSLGGAVCMNAGAYGGEMKQVITEVEVLTPDGIRRVSGEEADFGYRHSAFSDGSAVVLSARMALAPGQREQIHSRMEELMAKRKNSQPLDRPSAGSTFKRPEGNYAGTLIDQCGLKGLTLGGAQVSTKHAGFVINRGNATCQDVMELIGKVRDTVYASTGILLEPEVKVIGKDGTLWKF